MCLRFPSGTVFTRMIYNRLQCLGLRRYETFRTGLEKEGGSESCLGTEGPLG